MKNMMTTVLALSMLMACNKPVNPDNNEGKDDKPEQPEMTEPQFAKGADIGWVTEMESKGYKFYGQDGEQKECTALMKDLGCTAIRHRVWVNPAEGWCSLSDLLVKCRRVKENGMDLMVDFHYSDSWADPGKQNIPAAWTGHSADELASKVTSHTKEVLQALKSEGISVSWVQVGNEVTNGMLWPTCKVQGQDAAAFVKVFNAGSKAVKEIYPNAKVVLHIDNAWKGETVKWFYDLMAKAGADYDIIGLSLYPSYWDDNAKAYPDWKSKTYAAVNTIKGLNASYGKDVMLVEFGMPASQPDKAKAALQYVLDNTRDLKFFKGIFLWEPESEKERNGYDYGAFASGKPTAAMEPFKN